MTPAIEKIELYGQAIDFNETKIKTNAIRREFVEIASNWKHKITKEFYKIYTNLDDLYANHDDLGNEIRLQCVNTAMKFLVAHGIYEISDEQFYEQFITPYDSWENDLEPIVTQYETIIGNAVELDEYRTARRKNRSQWIGYGTKQAVYDADAKNLISNIGHGVFNLMAKGVSAIADSVKKDEIFRSEGTVQLVEEAADNVVMGVFLGTIVAINEESPGALYDYSSDEMKKTRAIIENIEKERIPEEAKLSSLIKAIQFYPYNSKIYFNLLRNFGGDQGRLDEAVAFFGVEALNIEKSTLFAKKLKQFETDSIDSISSNLPELKSYANYICYEDFEADCQRMIQEISQRKHKNDNFDANLTADNHANRETRKISLEVAAQGLKSNANYKFYAAPDLPWNKIIKFQAAHSLKIPDEDIVFFFDDTVFGSGDNGVVVDINHITVRLAFYELLYIRLTDITEIEISGMLNKKILFRLQNGNSVDFSLTQSNSGAKILCEAIRGLVHLKRSSELT